MKNILVGSAIIMALGITNADANAYKIIEREDGGELCKFTTAVEKASYGGQIADRFGMVTEFSCRDWPYGFGPGVIYYMEGAEQKSPSALVSNGDGVPPYFHENKWRIGNFFYGEELHFDFSTKTWTRFDSHQRVVKSGKFKVEQIPHLALNKKTGVCKLNDSEGVEAGVGVYTYDPSTAESFYSGAGRPGHHVTNFGTELYVYANLKPDPSFWSGGDYMYEKVIKNIWAGDEPGSILTVDPLYRQVQGWEDPLAKCSGCGVRFKMDFTSTLEGTWSAEHWNQNNYDPVTGMWEWQTTEGSFLCSEW
jgi:hypothetical protein